MGRGKVSKKEKRMRQIRRMGWLSILLGLLAGSICRADTYRIEQVNVYMPEVTACYRSPEDEAQPEAFLGGQELSMEENQVFADTQIPVTWYILADISGSIPDGRFEDVKDSVKTFRQQLREGDRLVMYTFGDEVTQVLSGGEDAQIAEEIIDALAAHDQNTLLFDAIDQAADQIYEEEGAGESRCVLLIISDGKDCADNTKSTQTAKNRLLSDGIPLYTLAVENNEGDSETEINSYRSKFSELASETGGIPWTIDQGESVLEGLEQTQTQIMESYRAVFSAETNVASNQTEDFVLRFPGGRQDSRQVLVSRSHPDDAPPEVTGAEVRGERELALSFSEAMEGAQNAQNYAIEEKGGRKISVTKADWSPKEVYTVLLELGDTLYNETYTISLTGMTDTSAQKNPLEDTTVTVEASGLEDPDTSKPKVKEILQSGEDGFLITYSEEVSGADNPGSYTVMLDEERIPVSQVLKEEETAHTWLLLVEGGLKNGTWKIHIDQVTDTSLWENPLKETDVEVSVDNIRPDLLGLFLKWWPVALTVVVLLLIALLLLIRRRIRRREVTIVDGRMVSSDKVERKVHVGVGDVPAAGADQPVKHLTIWLSNGTDAPRKLEQVVRGSIFVGRSSKDTDIYCDDVTMSKQHFSLSVEPDGGIYVTDLDSRNGTSVNGLRIKGKERIVSGDEIRAGNIRFRVEW